MLTNKIIWSVNLFDDPEMQKQALYFLGALTRPTGIAALPVFVSDGPLDRALGLNRMAEGRSSLIQKQMSELRQNTDIGSMLPGKIVDNTSTSVRAHVQALLDFAAGENAEAILVSTHARKGVYRFFLGSFAETLILNSKIPIITTNPQTKVRERISKILFPTFFRPESRRAFEETVTLAQRLDAKLSLFYKEPLLPPLAMSAEVYALLESEARERSQEAMKWQEFAIAAGVATEVHLDNHAGYAAQAIEAYASKQNMDLIVMATTASAWSSLIAGSVTRQVIREAPCPVWTFRA